MREKLITSEKTLEFSDGEGANFRIIPYDSLGCITIGDITVDNAIVIHQDLALELAQVLLNFAESGELNEANNV